MSKNDAKKWCQKLCQKWFQNMMPKIISTNDVKKWCQKMMSKMMSKNDIKNYAKTMPDMESGYPSTDLFDAMFGIIFDIILA